MKANELKNKLKNGGFDAIFTQLYGAEQIGIQQNRYEAAISAFEERYGIGKDLFLFSVAGRSEISGNHTDHQHGRVLAASISLDVIAVASKNNDNRIRIKSEGFPMDEVSLLDIAPKESRFYHSDAIIAGVCDGFIKNGYAIGGYDAYTTSNVLKGSGLSSSAAFEDMVGNILRSFYNDGAISNEEMAKISQYAENVFFGKPCGLMDQMACAVGGFIAIDFCDPSHPVVQKMDFDLTQAGYSLCIVNTGGNHADLNEDYASVPAEMKKIASYFGKSVLREVTLSQIQENVSALRTFAGDRAILRAIHFLCENERVAVQTEALKRSDLTAFLEGVIASGRSSFQYLQNVYTTKNAQEQGLSLALALAELYLSDKKGAWRVHGGGFAGTIQAFVPNAMVADFQINMNQMLGEKACTVLKVRPVGAICISTYGE